MRIGSNPLKDTGAVAKPQSCRVVVPVYIPERTGYFVQSLDVLGLCLESLHVTAGKQATVTVVSNGCAPEVVTELESMFASGWIDHLILSQSNLGKTGAISAVLKGATEELLAWTDCDVLFKPGWLEAVVQVFQAFPECGAVTPFPAVHQAWEFTSATTLGAFANRCIGRAGLVPAQDLDEYAQSVGTPSLFRDEYKRSPWVVHRGTTQACVGAMHFMCCVRREVLQGMPDRPTAAALKGSEDNDYLDLPPERLGLWRLSTVKSHVWHMGNSVETWMLEHVERLRNLPVTNEENRIVLPKLKRSLVSRLPLGTRQFGARILRRLLEKSFLKTLSNKVKRRRNWKEPRGSDSKLT